MNGKSQFEENAVCDACGRFGAFAFGNQHLCMDCYEGRGSCCSEFSGNDLCEPEEPTERQKEQKAPKPAKP